MNRRELFVISVLVVLALCLPAWILYGGLSDAAEREWSGQPWEGTLASFQVANSDLLEGTAAVLMAHPEFIESCYDWSGAGVASITRRSVSGGWIRHDTLSEAEWACVQRLFEPPGCQKIIWRPGLYSPREGWIACPSLIFCVRTTRDGWNGMLIFLPEADQPEGSQQVLDMLRELYRIEKTVYPGWYAAE